MRPRLRRLGLVTDHDTRVPSPAQFRANVAAFLKRARIARMTVPKRMLQEFERVYRALGGKRKLITDETTPPSTAGITQPRLRRLGLVVTEGRRAAPRRRGGDNAVVDGKRKLHDDD